MSDTLAQLTDKVQAQLKDDGTLFPDATVTTSIRQALADLNIACPQTATASTTAVADQKEYELSDEDAAATGILDIVLQGDDEYDTPLQYDAYVEDSRWFFRLRTPQAAGETLLVRYTKPHTVGGLDSATDSTLTDALNVALIDGACYYACLSRAAGTIESNNVQPNVAAQWMEVARLWQTLYLDSLRVARRQPTVKAEPSTIAWNDPQHDPEYP